MESNEPNPSVKLPENVWAKYDCNYTLPKPEGDIWANCLKPLLEEDERQCKAWRDEVQNLLIFAGLFSAVVTTFVVDSYKNLQSSPDQRTVDLLSQVLACLDNSSSNFNASSSSPFLSPSPSSIRVNTLWFTSLAISLTTVLVGVVSLQWIREYEYYSGHWTPKQVFEIQNLRHESMNKWFVPQIFTGLPVLLQTAVVLFFIGLMDLLLHLYPRTAIPTIIIISTTLTFIVLTTILPTLQYHTTNRFECLDMPTTPFPYKSPQSWVMLLSMSKFIGKSLQLFRQWVTYWIYGFDDMIWNYPKISNWNAFDWQWLRMRSQQVSGFLDRDQSHHYDTAHGVAYFITKYCQSNESLALSAYHCFLEQHNTNWNVVYRWSPQSQSHFYKCLKPPEGHISFIDCELAPSSLWGFESLRQDTSMRIFLGIFNTHSSCIPGIRAMILRQKMELLIRMSKHLRVSELLDSALASELQWLYPKMVYTAITNTTAKTTLWQPEAAGIAEVAAMMDLCSTPSLADRRERIKYTHVKLATKILESGTDRDACHLNLLTEWEEYKESLVFLTHATYNTMDKHPEIDHNPVITSRMRDFLTMNSVADLRDRIPKWYPLTRKKFDKLLQSHHAILGVWAPRYQPVHHPQQYPLQIRFGEYPAV